MRQRRTIVCSLVEDLGLVKRRRAPSCYRADRRVRGVSLIPEPFGGLFVKIGRHKPVPVVRSNACELARKCAAEMLPDKIGEPRAAEAARWRLEFAKLCPALGRPRWALEVGQ